MASGRDSQSLVLDHLKFVQVGRGHFSEPEGGGVVQDGAQDGLLRGHQRFSTEAPAWHCKGFYDVKGHRGTLDPVAVMRAEGEVGVQRDSLDYTGSVQQGSLFSDSYLWVEPGLVGFHCVWFLPSLFFQEYSYIHMGELILWIVFNTVAIRMYRSTPFFTLDSCQK